MIEITVTRDNLLKGTSSIDLSMNNFEEISDVLHYVKLTKIFEPEVKMTSDFRKAIVENLHSNPANKVIKDGSEYWTKEANVKLQEEMVKLMSEEVTFNLEPIDVNKMKTYPPTMGNFIKVFYELFQDITPEEEVPAKGKKNGKD